VSRETRIECLARSLVTDAQDVLDNLPLARIYPALDQRSLVGIGGVDRFYRTCQFAHPDDFCLGGSAGAVIGAGRLDDRSWGLDWCGRPVQAMVEAASWENHGPLDGRLVSRRGGGILTRELVPIGDDFGGTFAGQPARCR